MAIAVLLSGGVDSSVALRLLQQGRSLGQEIRAFYLKIWLEDELAALGQCPWEEDLDHARAVCAGAGVELHVLSLQREYRRQVVEYTVSELEAGRTPSPDLLCNARIKFGAFLDQIDDRFRHVASGHYAQIRHSEGTAQLFRNPDPVKDQTYFLSRLRPDQLERCVFPLGSYTKEEVRGLARDFELPNRDRPDSQGICFLGKIPFDAFVRHHLGDRPGKIREIGTERVLGTHQGHWFYTVGQRRGLGLSGGPWHVVAKHTESNTVYITHREHLEERARRSFSVTDLHWLGEAPKAESGPLELSFKLRHGPSLVPGALTLDPDCPSKARIELQEADPGVAPGQFAVLYQGERCLGSGMICDEP